MCVLALGALVFVSVALDTATPFSFFFHHLAKVLELGMTWVRGFAVRGAPAPVHLAT